VADSDDLQQVFREYSTDLTNIIVELLRAPPEERRKLFLRAIHEIRDWQQQTTRIFGNILLDTATDNNDERKALLLFVMPQRADLSKDELRTIATAELDKSLKYFDAVFNSIHALASAARGQLGTRRVLHVIGASHNRRPTDAEIRKRLRERLVTIIGQDGKSRQYAPEKYADLVQDTAEGSVGKQIAFAHAAKLGADLVQVSDNPSSLADGCFCNIYRGKVFSLSGQHPICPPLSTLPAGGVPMHAKCRHWLLPIDESRFSTDQLAAMSRIPDAFRQLGAEHGTTSQFVALYHSRDWSK